MTPPEARLRWPHVCRIVDEELPGMESDVEQFLMVIGVTGPEAEMSALSNDAMERMLSCDCRADAEVVMRASLRLLRLVLEQAEQPTPHLH